MGFFERIIKKSNPVPVGATAPCTYAGKDCINIVHGYPNYMSGKRHTGIDISCKRWNKVVAVGDGVIHSVREGTKLKTSYVALEIGSNIIYYKHTKLKRGLKVGDSVKIGDVIGRAVKDKIYWGGWHIHFQLNDGGGVYNDPIIWLLAHQPMLKYKFSQYTMVGAWYRKHKKYFDRMRKA